MHDFWKFMDDNWFLIMIFGGGSLGTAGPVSTSTSGRSTNTDCSK